MNISAQQGMQLIEDFQLGHKSGAIIEVHIVEIWLSAS